MDEEQENKTLKEEISQLNENLEYLNKKKIKKVKEFKIPFSKRVRGRKARENYITVMYINENGGIVYKKKQIKDQSITINGIPRLATAEYVLRYKRNPMIIQPSWSVEPFSPKENKKKTSENEMDTSGYRILLNIIKSEAIKGVKKMGWGLSIGAIIILGIIIYALFTSG